MVEFDVEAFLEEHWQRSPRLVRGAIAGAAAIANRERLFELAATLPSRVVELDAQGAIERLRHGPFSTDDLQPGGRWTLLVQQCDRALPSCASLLESFRFVPNWRLDDAMLSFATDGGGIGMHVDRYDVFLIQLSGRRRWSYGDAQATLAPGDMLYLPPGVPHDGVAVGDCLTCSIGFRVPDPRELAAGFLRSLDDAAFDRFADPGRQPPEALGEIRREDRAQLREQAIALFDRRFDAWLGCHLTHPLRGIPEGQSLDSIEEIWRRLDSGESLRRLAPVHFAWFTDDDSVVQLFVGGERHRLGRRREALAELICGSERLDRATLGPHRARTRLVEALVDAIQRGYLRWS